MIGLPLEKGVQILDIFFGSVTVIDEHRIRVPFSWFPLFQTDKFPRLFQYFPQFSSMFFKFFFFYLKYSVITAGFLLLLDDRFP